MKRATALTMALRRFVIRHEIFVEAREFDDGPFFIRRWTGRGGTLGLRRNFEVFLRRRRRRVHFYTMTCRSTDEGDSRVLIDFPETALLRPARAAIEYEACGRVMKRYAARYPDDAEAGRALFGYVRSESRMLRQLLGEERYRELLRIVRRHQRRRGAGA